MREYTQTDIEHGNCWQTSIACILDVAPNSLPPQVYWEGHAGLFEGRANYLNVMNGYLGVHHNLIYSEVYDYAFCGLQVKEPGYHLLIGPTERSEEQREQGARHSTHDVVGRYGSMVWDPHPSRAGLLYVERWGVLSTIPDRILKRRAKLQYEDGEYNRVMSCLCPQHYNYEDSTK